MKEKKWMEIVIKGYLWRTIVYEEFIKNKHSRFQSINDKKFIFGFYIFFIRIRILIFSYKNLISVIKAV